VKLTARVDTFDKACCSLLDELRAVLSIAKQQGRQRRRAHLRERGHLEREKDTERDRACSVIISALSVYRLLLVLRAVCCKSRQPTRC
jgi:hypothetical protein